METKSIRVRPTTHLNLRRIYGITGESIQAVLERLVAEELERVRKEDAKRDMLKVCCDCKNP